MPAVLLVRHGQASFGAEDYDVLSEVGREQSAHVGAELGRRRLRSPAVACGSLRRQRDTAAIACEAAALAVDICPDPRWDEYDHHTLIKRYVPPDSAHDGTSKGLQALLDLALAEWVADASGDWAAFAGRARAALDDLVDGLPSGRDAIVFTSGGVIAALCGGLLDLGPGGFVALNRVTANGAITKVVVGSGGTSLVSFNDHAHFEGDARRLLTYR